MVLVMSGLTKLRKDTPFFAAHHHEPTLAADSLMQQDTMAKVSDTLTHEKPLTPKAATVEKQYPTGKSYVGLHHLNRFFEALHQARNGRKVRIGYFGDSMIEGDLVTESLRHDLQEEFGGQGVGFVPIACASPGFRKTIRHSYSEGWKYHTILVPNPTKFNYSIAGNFAYLPRKGKRTRESWVKYKGTSLYETTSRFPQVKLYYGQYASSSKRRAKNWVAVSTDKGADTLKLDSRSVVNTITLSRSNIEELELNFRIDDRLPVYGLSIEGGPGVYVDNFAVRGNSGLGILNIAGPVWKEFDKHMHYDLVVLHYGLNVIDTQRKSYKGYEKHFKKVIAYVKEQLPKADILVVSVSDKSTMINGKMQTDPAVPKIVAAQRRAAEEMEVAFLDLYRGMGGRNTMVKWVEKKLATKDYTHVNRRGAKIVSNIVKKYLMTQYYAWERESKQLASQQ